MNNAADKLASLQKFEIWTQKSTTLADMLKRELTNNSERFVLSQLNEAKLKVEEARAELYKHLEIV